jgi:uncharacterized protein (DUF1499 family)
VDKQILIVLFGLVFLMGCAGMTPKLGLFNDHLVPCPQSPNCVSSQIIDKKKFIEPFYFIGSQQETQARLLLILKTLQRTNIIDIQDNYVRVEFTSKIFKFIDDVEFYFPVTKSATTIIYFRSASRLGYSDLGANRKRIEQMRQKLKGY